MTLQQSPPRIYADFNRLDENGCVLLDRVGTLTDLEDQGVKLEEGLHVLLYMDDGDKAGNPDDLEVIAVVISNSRLKCWTGKFDSASFRHASEK